MTIKYALQMILVAAMSYHVFVFSTCLLVFLTMLWSGWTL